MKTLQIEKTIMACAFLAVWHLPVAGFAGPGESAAASDETGLAEVVSIQVSPATIILDRPVRWITVHAEIPRSVVLPGSVTLNGVPADIVTADNRGELVAKFYYTGIAGLLEPPSAVLTLSGLAVDSGAFSGSAEVSVR